MVREARPPNMGDASPMPTVPSSACTSRKAPRRSAGSPGSHSIWNASILAIFMMRLRLLTAAREPGEFRMSIRFRQRTNGAKLMVTSRFPKTHAVVSRLGFGGAAIGLTNYLGPYDAKAERTAAVETVRAAVSAGVTYFDTAPGYGDGLSEEIFGEALERIEGLTIATKVKADPLIDVRESLETSLRRLRRPRIDLLQIHGTS